MTPPAVSLIGAADHTTDGDLSIELAAAPATADGHPPAPDAVRGGRQRGPTRRPIVQALSQRGPARESADEVGALRRQVARAAKHPKWIGLAIGLVGLASLSRTPLEAANPKVQSCVAARLREAGCLLTQLAPLSMAGIAALVTSFWVFGVLPLPVTALLPLLLMPLLGVESGRVVSMQYFPNALVMFLGGFFVAMAMQKWHLHTRIAMATILRVGVQPRRLLFGIMAVTWLMSMWMCNSVCTMTMMPSVGALSDALSRAHGSPEAARFSSGLLIGVAFSAGIGGIATQVGTPPNLIFVRALEAAYPGAKGAVMFSDWMAFALPTSLVLVLATYAVLAYRYCPPSARLRLDMSLIRGEHGKLGPMSREERIVGATFVTMVLLWVFRGDINMGAFTVTGWSTLVRTPAYIDDGTVAVAACALLFLLPARPRVDSSGGGDSAGVGSQRVDDRAGRSTQQPHLSTPASAQPSADVEATPGAGQRPAAPDDLQVTLPMCHTLDAGLGCQAEVRLAGMRAAPLRLMNERGGAEAFAEPDVESGKAASASPSTAHSAAVDRVAPNDFGGTDASPAEHHAVRRVGAGPGSGTILDWETASHAPWHLLLLLGGGFALAHGFQVSGLSAFLGSKLAFLEGTHPVVVATFVSLLVAALTNLSNNTAIANVMMPVMAAAAAGAKAHPFVYMLPATLGASFSFILPVATPPNVIIMSSRLVTADELMRAGLMVTALATGVSVLATTTWASVVWGDVASGIPSGWLRTP